MRHGFLAWRKWCAFILLASIWAIPLPCLALSWLPFGYDGISYAIRFEGLDADMLAWMKELKLDQRTETNPPKTLEELDQEANTLAAKTKKALESKGYVEALAEPRLEQQGDASTVVISAQPGKRYSVSDVRFEWNQEALQELSEIPITSKAHAPLDMQAAQKDAETLSAAIGKNACLLSLVVTPKVRLYAAEQSAELVFEIDHGPKAHYGAVIIEGNEKVKDEVVQRAVAWKPGGCYEANKLDETRSTLIQSQLFSTVAVAPVEPVDASGLVPIKVTVKERVARTVGVGTNYSTDKGFGVTGSWEHRNLMGSAEKLNTDITLAEMEQSVGGTYRIPAFRRKDQLLAISGRLKHEDTDLYVADTLEGSVSVERKLSKRLNSGVGVGYLLTDTTDPLTGNNKYALLSLPTFLEYEGRDNTLDARKGMFGRIAATPYTETIGDGGQFVKLQATGQGYVSRDNWLYKPTMAARLSVGSIEGAKGKNVPADIRFYAGGGGSVRGYSYQSLAPQTAGIATGGASLIEASGELRARFTQDIGGVIFLDAGNSYADSVPSFSEKLYYGAGVGARYYSPIGPLRVDMAFPLNGSDIGQTGYQLYVSLGQAF